MSVSKKQYVYIGAALVLVVVLGFGSYYWMKTRIPAFPLNSSDAIASWNFKGAYTGNETLVAQANTDISKLKALLGKGEYDDYDLYNGIANDFELLGDGHSAYSYYNYSIHVHTDKGLAYVNLAHLMEDLHAYHTAADAYTKAVTVEPKVIEYHIERLQYLTGQFPNDSAQLLAAFTDASTQFGDAAPILTIEAQWLTQVKRYADAIKAWQTVKMLSPQDRQVAIDLEIVRLKAKQ